MALVSKALGLTTYLIDFLLIFCLSVISSFEADDGAPAERKSAVDKIAKPSP
jgi:hypothetical protein